MHVSSQARLKKPFEAYRGDAPYVFVSYAHDDAEAVYAELARLKRLGLNVWYDEGVSPGSRWSDELAERITRCVLFLYFVTPRSVASRNCQDEANFALDSNKPILVVHLEETELPPGLQLRLGPRQAILRHELEPGIYESKLRAAITARASQVTPEDVEPTQAQKGWSGRPMIVIVGAAVLMVLAALVTVPRLIPVSPPPTVSGYTQLTKSQVIFPPVPSVLPLVTDASRIYFNDWDSGRPGMRQLSQAGGEAIRVASPFDDPDTLINPHDMTPDGSQLLIGSFKPGSDELPSLWLWPVVGGDPRRLGEAGGAAYSPDGSQLLYTDGGPNIFVARTDLTASRKLATATGKVYWPRFSPDGRRIRFTVSRTNNTLWEIAFDGTDLHPLLEEWDSADHCCGSWTPDGKYYVFQATHDHRTQIWAIREQGGLLGRRQSEPMQLTTGALNFIRPTIAEEGKKIFAIGWQLRGEVVQYDSESGRFVPVPGLESLSAEWLAYSRDQEWIAYISYPEGDLWRSKSDGSNRLQLTFPPMQVYSSTWAPDGQTLAFEGQLPGEQWQIYTVSTEGGNPRLLATDDLEAWAPTWSPDGGSLAFSAVGEDGIYRVHILDLATAELSELEGSDGLLNPAWSPGGRYLAARSRDRRRMMLFDVTMKQWEELLETDNISIHYWAGNEHHLYFYGPFWLADDRWVYRVDTRDRTVEKIALVGDVRAAWGVNGIWVGLTPDGSPMLLRDLSIHHIYALDWQSD